MMYRRLPLIGLKNARDIGGYPADGGITKFQRFIRCESPRALTKSDIELIKAYGITLSIDFRGDREVARYPSMLENEPGIEYRRCPTYDKQLAFAAIGNTDRAAFVNWGEKYIRLLENGREWVCDTLKTMSRANGAVLYNCTTGKDRTGVITALLLGLAGVAKEDIIADYCVSELYLKDIYGSLLSNEPGKKVAVDIQSPYLKTAPENMEVMLSHLEDAFGGVENYVATCGVTPDEIAGLRKKLIADKPYDVI